MKQLLYFSIFLIFLMLGIVTKAQDKVLNHSFDKMQSGEWNFKGNLGIVIDKLASNRILDKEAWEVIYPEAEDAFRKREDDSNYPVAGKWRGEFWGRYILSAIAAARYYDQAELKPRIRAAVEGILSTQDENGYMGTYQRSGFVEGDNWNLWGRKYTLWALIEACQFLSDSSLLAPTKKFANHIISETGPGTTDIIKTGTFYGMASTSILYPMVRLAVATGDKKYLDYAKYIVDQWQKHPEGLPDILGKGLTGLPVHLWFPDHDPYQWAKGSELLSCAEGLAELYSFTGETRYLRAAENIHQALVKWERSPVGSLGFNDKYMGANALINTFAEICDVVYWNRLSLRLFTLTGKTVYIDEFERSLYNSLMCASDTAGTWGLRRLRMSHQHIPAQNHFLMNHHCCVDNLPRGFFQAAEAVLFVNGNTVFFSLFNQGTGKVQLHSGNQFQLALNGDFMEQGVVYGSISLQNPEKFDLAIRCPHWSKKTEIMVNGVKNNSKIQDGWIIISREWKTGDNITLRFQLEVWWDKFDTTLFSDKFHPLEFYDKEWANFSFAGGSNPDLLKRFKHVTPLPPGAALPHQPAVTFFVGPVALARDTRFSGNMVFTPLTLTPGRKSIIKFSRLTPPTGIDYLFELHTGKKETTRFCNFSSAGNTWNNESEFNTWNVLKY